MNCGALRRCSALSRRGNAEHPAHAAQRRSAVGLEPVGTDREFSARLHSVLGIGAAGSGANAMSLLARIQAGQQIKHRFLIGDTPSDIMAASAIGARSIAVATGRHNRESLEDAGADHVLDSLADVDAVLSLLRVKT